MKKKFFSWALLAITLVLTACSSSPTSAMKDYAELMQKRDYEHFVEGFDCAAMTPEMTSKEKARVEESKAALVELLKKGDKDIDKKGGITNIDITNEVMKDDGKNAVVTMCIHYGDGSEETQTQEMTLINDEWKMCANK